MTPRPSTEQLLVQVLMRSTQDALRALEEHPDDAERRVQVAEELEHALAPIWNRLPYLTLDIGADDVRWRDLVVLSREEDAAGLAATLSQSGIQALTLVPGVEKDELPRFLEVLVTKRRLDADGDQDLVTMLFREDLQHVRYTVGSRLPLSPTTGEPEALTLRPAGGGIGEDALALETTPLEAGPLETTVPTELRDAVRREAEEPDERRGVVQLEKFDSTLYFLDQREIEYLRDAIAKQYAHDEVGSVLAILLDILQLQSARVIRDEVIAVLRTLMPYLLGTGRFDSVAYLTAEIRKLARTVDFEADQREELASLRMGVSESKALAQLFYALEGGDVEPTPEKLGVLMRELSPEAIQNVLVWVGQLQRAEAKSALVNAIEQFFSKWPNALDRMLTASDRTVVHRALGIAAKLRRPEFVDLIERMIDTDDARARQLAAKALAGIGNAPALRQVTLMVDDPDGEVRREVLEALAARPYRGASKPLERALGAKDLEDRDLAERRALFEAFGAASGPAGVSALEPVLFGKGSLARRPSSETRACAAVALGVINSPAARFALQKAANDKDPVVRSAASAALREDD